MTRKYGPPSFRRRRGNPNSNSGPERDATRRSMRPRPTPCQCVRLRTVSWHFRTFIRDPTFAHMDEQVFFGKPITTGWTIGSLPCPKSWRRGSEGHVYSQQSYTMQTNTPINIGKKNKHRAGRWLFFVAIIVFFWGEGWYAGGYTNLITESSKYT